LLAERTVRRSRGLERGYRNVGAGLEGARRGQMQNRARGVGQRDGKLGRVHAAQPLVAQGKGFRGGDGHSSLPVICQLSRTTAGGSQRGSGMTRNSASALTWPS